MNSVLNNNNLADILSNPMLLYLKLKENGYDGEELAYKMYQIQKNTLENQINGTSFITELAKQLGKTIVKGITIPLTFK